MRQKQLTVYKAQTGKRWSVTMSGSDKDLLAKLQWAIKTTAKASNAVILNAADPFGEQLPLDGAIIKAPADVGGGYQPRVTDHRNPLPPPAEE